MADGDVLASLQSRIWAARLQMEIRLAPGECRSYDQVDPYLIACPRLTYLPSLLPRLLAFFTPHLIVDSTSVDLEAGYFVYDSIPLKWHLPIGLLYDLHLLSTQRVQSDGSVHTDGVFRIVVHFSPSIDVTEEDRVPSNDRALNDAFINSVKEADFLRSGNAKPIMSLSAADSKSLWASAKDNDLTTFVKIHNSLLPSVGQLRHVPLRVYVPSSDEDEPAKARIKVLQGQFTPSMLPSGSTATSQLRTAGVGRTQPQTLGSALHALIPSLFPSRRAPLIARPILHGVQVPMAASLDDLARKCCYADGWINVVIAMGG